MKTLILGGGLSGLALAERLETQGHDYLLLEARDRFGGRILSEQHGTAAFDLGPTWFWPGQPRIAALIDRLNLTKFAQLTQGDLIFENERGHVQRGQAGGQTPHSWRLDGGMEVLTRALAERLPEARKRLNAPVTKLAQANTGRIATLRNGETFEADQIVLAMPPRIAAQITFTPALPDATMHAINNIATWMAGQAKAVMIYDQPLWRDAGLSGHMMSRVGPMVEIHDASPQATGPFALFGFIGVPPHARADAQALRQQIKAQLLRLFGPDAPPPTKLFLKDWAFDPFTATERDQAPLYTHPAYGLPKAMHNLWDGNLMFAGSEVAPDFGGYIEGALEAAENVLAALTRSASHATAKGI